MNLKAAVTAGVLGIVSSCLGPASVSVAQVPALGANPAAATPGSPKEVARLIQENSAAIQRFAVTQRDANPELKTVLEKSAEQSRAFREKVDAQFMAKDAQGATVLKKEKALLAEIDDLSKKLKDKQHELSLLSPQRADVFSRLSKEKDYQALSAENASKLKSINDELFAVVGRSSEEGKRLIEERTRLIELQRPAPPHSAVSETKPAGRGE